MGGVKGKKAARRLARRVAAWEDAGGQYPRGNPGKEAGHGAGHIMHKPGSNKK